MVAGNCDPSKISGTTPSRFQTGLEVEVTPTKTKTKLLFKYGKSLQMNRDYKTAFQLILTQSKMSRYDWTKIPKSTGPFSCNRSNSSFFIHLHLYSNISLFSYLFSYLLFFFIFIFSLHLRWNNWGIIADETSYRWRIQVSSDIKQVVMSWLISKNLVELELIIYIYSL